MYTVVDGKSVANTVFFMSVYVLGNVTSTPKCQRNQMACVWGVCFVLTRACAVVRRKEGAERARDKVEEALLIATCCVIGLCNSSTTYCKYRCVYP